MFIALVALAAIACLILDVVLGQIVLAYVALGLCLLGILVLGADLMRQRHARRRADQETTETSEPDAPGSEPVESDTSQAEASDFEGAGNEPVGTAGDQSEPAPSPPEPPDLDRLPAVSIGGETGGELMRTPFVRVVPGYRRYHVAGCRLLDSHLDEEITLTEAHEEGFTACTACSR